MTVSLVQNFFKQTVTTPWTVGTGNFYVSQKPNVTSGFLVISPNSESLREIVAFSAVGTDGGGDYVTVSARGLGGTTEQAHGAGEKVYMNITAQHIEQIKQAIEDISNAGALNASTTTKGVSRLSVSPNISLGNPTITIASPAVVTLTAHGLTENDEIQFTTTGALPTGIVAATKYYVIGTGLTANTFQFSETFGGAAVNTSGSQSGTHTLTRVTPKSVGDNDPRIPSSDIAAALAGGGLFGTPDSDNKFLTQEFTTKGITDQEQATQNASTAVGQADTATNRRRIAQSFVPTEPILSAVRLHKAANTGTFTGTVTVSIQADNAGSPSNTDLIAKTITNQLYNAYSVGEFIVKFATELTVTPGTTYWIVVIPSTADNANCPNIGTNSAGGYANGLTKYYNTTDNWTTISGIDLFFRVVEGVNDKAPLINSTTGKLPPTSYAPRIAQTQLAAASVYAHGLGVIPVLVEGMKGAGSTLHGGFIHGSYSVAQATHVSSGFWYNEGSSGGDLGNSGVLFADVASNGTLTASITVVAVDENVVVFNTNGTGFVRVMA